MEMPINSLAKHLNFFDVDVVIVNYNAGTLLVDCVRSAFTGGAALVIVVDNNSTDGSLENLGHAIASERLLVIRNAKNLGFAAACNIGIHRSHAGHILFLNPDSVLTNDALGTMVRASQSAATTGMVSGILCNLDGSSNREGGGYSPPLDGLSSGHSGSLASRHTFQQFSRIFYCTMSRCRKNRLRLRRFQVPACWSNEKP